MPRKEKLIEVIEGSGVVDWYSTTPKEFLTPVDNPNKHLHNFNIPFRALINSPSGSGKTSFLLSLIKLFQEGKGTYPDIFIITRNSDEPLYNQIQILEGIHNLPNLDKFDKEENHLVCLDDMMTVKDQTPIINYFIRCRKLNCSIVYLTQNYFSVPPEIRQKKELNQLKYQLHPKD